MIGIPIGFLIGIVTGTIFLVLLKTVHGAKIDNTASVVAIVSEISAIPTFWFGGPWVTTSLLKLVSLDAMINSYIVTLAIVFGTYVSVPVFRWIAQTATMLGKEG
jgi:hypothetical protein